MNNLPMKLKMAFIITSIFYLIFLLCVLNNICNGAEESNNFYDIDDLQVKAFGDYDHNSLEEYDYASESSSDESRINDSIARIIENNRTKDTKHINIPEPECCYLTWSEYIQSMNPGTKDDYDVALDRLIDGIDKFIDTFDSNKEEENKKKETQLQKCNIGNLLCDFSPI